MKITELFKNWPPNTIATSKWLQTMGISRQLLYKYTKSEYIIKVANGCYKKQGEEVDWTGALYAVQKQLDLDIYPFGYSALELHEYRHHITMQNKNIIQLCGAKGEVPPKWFMNSDFGVEISYKTSTLFRKKLPNIEQQFRGNYQISVPAPEVSILQVLEDVNDSNSFEDALNITENLIGLQLNRMQEAFNECNSYKVKRLFLFLAKYTSLPILNDLKYTTEDLGNGVLQIVEHGKYNQEFKIMIPNQFKDKGDNPF